MRSIAIALSCISVLALLWSCAHEPVAARAGQDNDAIARKIELDLDALDPRGLQGPPDGLRSMAYEFCIPAKEDYVLEVTAIDSTAKIYRQSPGRIQCREDQYLCVGETHQPDHLAVLNGLASLAYVQRIVPAYFE